MHTHADGFGIYGGGVRVSTYQSIHCSYQINKPLCVGLLLENCRALSGRNHVANNLLMVVVGLTFYRLVKFFFR